MVGKIKHPAKYSDCLLPIFKKELMGFKKVLDPFAGTGKLRSVVADCELLEIEPEWGNISGATIGDATNMPFPDSVFDAVCTSPTYGNRMADSFIDHQPHKKYKRNTYTHTLGRKLSLNNSGGMKFGEKYCQLHSLAWGEVYRVLKHGGKFILNISNHIKNGKEIFVTEWHIDKIVSIGFRLQKHIHVPTRRLKFGANKDARVSFESVIVFVK